MKIIISGGLGYVGGRLSKYLCEQGHSVTALSRQAASLPVVPWPQNLEIIHPDAAFSDAAILKGADAFIHLAALNENDSVNYPEKAIEVNILQTLRWLEKAYAAGIKKFIYFSTAHVYGKPLQGFYDENSLALPIHPYAITHKCAEDYVRAAAVEKGMDNLVIRLTNAFGAPAFPTADRWSLLVNDLCRSAVSTGKMTLLSDGLQWRDFICLEDVCKGLQHLLALQSYDKFNSVYNLGGGGVLTVWEMANLVKLRAEDFLGKRIELKRNEANVGEAPLKFQVDIEKLLQTGFRLTGSRDEEILSTLDFFKRYAR